MLCEYIFFIVCVCGKKRAIHPSQREKNEHRQLLSKSKQRSILNKPTKRKRHITNNIFHTHTNKHRPVWNEKENYRQTYRSKLQ